MHEVRQLAAPVMQVRVAPSSQKRKSQTTIEISWYRLNYTVKTSNFPFSNKNQGKYKTILNGVSGSFRSGQFVALMGPSGAGKSSLLECLAGRRTIGVTGDIKMSGKDRLKVGFVEQFDHLLGHLTVKESLIFASRLRNADRHYINHNTISDNLVKKLGLEVCVNTLAHRCSGGQRKRLSIALELVSKVDMLILDEPTTGLDSAATKQTIKAALSLTKQQRKPMATVATIHQPSGKIFNMFDKVYVLSNIGTCIYEGPPQELAQTLSLIGLSVPQFYNPADFVLEVASGEYAKQSIHLLNHYNKEFNRTKFESNSMDDCISIVNAINVDKSKRKSYPLKQIWILLMRTILTTVRDPQMSLIRLFTVFPSAFVISWIFNSNVGKASGCPPSKLMLWKLNLDDLIDRFQEERFQLQENLSLMFLTMMMCQFTSYSAIILTFPFEMNVFVKEYNNSYYSIFSYYVSKVVADLPFCLATSVGLTTIIYYMTGQIFDTYLRIYYVNLINFLVTLSGQSVGLIFGAMFLDDPNSAQYASGIVILPLFIFAGFFRKLSLMPKYMVAISYISYFRYSLSALLISIFGMNRCSYEHWLAELDFGVSNLTRPQWLKTMSSIFELQSFMGSDNVDDQTETDPETNIMVMFGGKKAITNGTETSLLLTQFEIDGSEDSFWHEIKCLSAFIGFMYVMIYVVLFLKVGRKK